MKSVYNVSVSCYSLGAADPEFTKVIRFETAARNPIQQFWKKYADTFAYYCNIGTAKVTVLNPFGEIVCKGSARLNVFNSAAIFNGFVPEFSL